MLLLDPRSESDFYFREQRTEPRFIVDYSIGIANGLKAAVITGNASLHIGNHSVVYWDSSAASTNTFPVVHIYNSSQLVFLANMSLPVTMDLLTV